MNSIKRHLGRMVRRSANPNLAAQVARLDRAWRLDGQREGRLENRLCWKMGDLSRANGERNPGECHKIQILSARLLGQISSWEKHYTI